MSHRSEPIYQNNSTRPADGDAGQDTTRHSGGPLQAQAERFYPGEQCRRGLHLTLTVPGTMDLPRTLLLISTMRPKKSSQSACSEPTLAMKCSKVPGSFRISFMSLPISKCIPAKWGVRHCALGLHGCQEKSSPCLPRKFRAVLQSQAQVLNYPDSIGIFRMPCLTDVWPSSRPRYLETSLSSPFRFLCMNSGYYHRSQARTNSPDVQEPQCSHCLLC